MTAKLTHKFKTVLPSGRCARFRELTTRQKLDIERRVAALKGDDVSDQVQTIATVLEAYTEPVKLRYVQEPVLGEDGAPVVRDGKPVTRDTAEVDIDATLAAVPEGAWRAVTFEGLTVEGPGHLLEVFHRLPDWRALSNAVNRSLAEGLAMDLVGGKVQAATSSAS